MVGTAIFRVDSSRQIGSGHLGRCLTLAAEINKTGRRCCFVCRAHQGNLNAAVTAAGHDLLELPVPAFDNSSGYAGWLGVLQEVDAHDTIAALSGQTFDALIVDHYALGRVWEEIVRPYATTLLAIDDLANRQHVADFLLDVTPIPQDGGRYDNLLSAGSRQLLGPRFALIRSEFRDQRVKVTPRRGDIRRVFVTFGGVDADNWTEDAIVALRQVFGSAMQIDIAMGGNSPHLGRLQEMADNDRKLRLYCDAPNISALMATADLGIGAAGTTSWERACLGLPTILSCIADNQRDAMAALAATGCAIALETDRASYKVQLAAALKLIKANPGLVHLMSRSALNLVDGRGAIRVAKELFPDPLVLRAALPTESRQIWQWRNEPDVRESSRSSEAIEFDDHARWFDAALTNKHIELLVCEVAGQPVSVVRFDLSSTASEISIYLTPNGFGRGIGTDVLRAAEAWLRRTRPEIKTIEASILPANGRSIAAFAAAGYETKLHCLEREL